MSHPDSGASTEWLLESDIWTEQHSYLGAERRLSTIPSLPDRDRMLRVHVLRNHPVETTIRLAQRLSGYLGVAWDVTYSPYDDSFSFTPEDSASDARLIWPDWLRIEPEHRADVLARVAAASHGVPTALILDTAHLEVDFVAEIRQTAAAFDLTLLELPALEATDTLDERMARMVGSALPMSWHLATAENIGIEWIASLVLPPLKLLAVDLDGTLYQGVLGEDGPAGVHFTPEHRELLDIIGTMRERGVLIVVLTKNDPRDIPALHEVWPPGGFMLADADRIQASWDSKGTALQATIRELGFDPRSVLFLDDNPGELAAVTAQLPGVWPVLAQYPRESSAVLRLQRSRIAQSDTTAGARSRDVKANAARMSAAVHGADLIEVHTSLETRVSASLVTPDDVARVCDLLERTNQFNLSLARSTRADIVEFMSGEHSGVSIIRVADRLSDSGTVGVLVARRSEDALLVEELALSCRVLGRGLESLLVALLAEVMSAEPAIDVLDFMVRRGPRNDPALEWLGRLVGTPITQDGRYRVELDSVTQDATRVRAGVRVLEGIDANGEHG